jgi:hypothetical protein
MAVINIMFGSFNSVGVAKLTKEEFIVFYKNLGWGQEKTNDQLGKVYDEIVKNEIKPIQKKVTKVAGAGIKLGNKSVTK